MSASRTQRRGSFCQFALALATRRCNDPLAERRPVQKFYKSVPSPKFTYQQGYVSAILDLSCQRGRGEKDAHASAHKAHAAQCVDAVEVCASRAPSPANGASDSASAARRFGARPSNSANGSLSTWRYPYDHHICPSCPRTTFCKKKTFSFVFFRFWSVSSLFQKRSAEWRRTKDTRKSWSRRIAGDGSAQGTHGARTRRAPTQRSLCAPSSLLQVGLATLVTA